MDGTVSRENKLASFETQYKEGVLSKPKSVNVTVTPDGIFGSAFICDQIGTKEDDMFYSSFECGFDVITKVYINANNKLQPIYIQCADNSTGVMNQRRIILAGFSNKDKDEIIRVIEKAREEYDERPEEMTVKSDSQAAVYSEKKLAFFETQYRENMMSTPYDVNITVTPLHIYGSGYICNRTGIKEDDPVYGKYTIGYQEITKIYINNSNKMAPIYIQCGDDNTGNKTSRRIILPKFDDDTKNKIIKAVEDAKAAYDEKADFRRESERRQKINELEARRKAQDDEFESLTSGYEEMFKREKPKAAPVQQEAAPAPKPAASAPAEREKSVERAAAAQQERPSPRPAPAPEHLAEPKPAAAPSPQRPAPKPAAAPAPQRQEPKPAAAPSPQRPEPKPAAAPAPQRPAPKPAPAPAPQQRQNPRPAPAPAPAPAPSPAPMPETPAMQELSSGSVTVDDILSLDEFLGIRAEDTVQPSGFFMDEISEEPDEEAINAMPVETIQKNPDKIEGLAIPNGAEHLEEVRDERPAPSAIEELNTIEEIAKKLAPRKASAPVPAAAPEPKPASVPEPEPAPVPVPQPVSVPEPERKIAPAPEPAIIPKPEASGEDMSLDDFETAVKKLKAMLDNGVITESEFAVEKKKLFKLLY